MEKSNKELIDHIKEVLNNREEPYQLGAWEKFQAQQKKHRRLLLWKIGFSTAASLTIIIAVWLNFDPSATKPRQIEQLPNKFSNGSLPGLKIEGDRTIPDEFIHHEIAMIPDFSNKLLGAKRKYFDREILPIIDQGQESKIIHSKFMNFVEPIKPGSLIGRNEMPKNQAPMGYPVFNLRMEGKADPNIRIGLAFSPAITTGEAEPNIGIGGGVSTDWSLSRKFSLVSGIYVSQNQLSYENSGSRSPTLTGLEDVRLNLVSLEIPINLQFNLNNNVFVSAGISSATLMKEHYSYTAHYDKLIKETTLSDKNEPVTTFRVVKMKESREISEPSFKSFNILAFYNFSIGYKHVFMERFNVSIEPFVKLPTMPLTSRELQYSTGGVQLKLKF
jgi:hypothetical protein